MSRRGVATVGLIALTCGLTLVSVISVWLRALVLDTDAYSRAIGPVLDDPQVRDALAGTIIDALYTQVDVTAELRAALPKNAAQFAPTLAAAIRSTSVQLASAALATPTVRQAWRQANRVAHDQIVHVLEGKGKIVATADGEVAIDTHALALQVRSSLHEHGISVFDGLPTDALEQRFVLFRSTDLMHAQRATRALDETATWLPFLTIAVGAGAIASSRRRRRTAEVLAVGVAAVMVVIAIGLAVGRAYYLARVGSSFRTIAAAPFDALVTPLRTWTQAIFVAALASAAVIWFTGSRSLVERERNARVVAFAMIRAHACTLAAAGAALAAVLLVSLDKPRPLVVYSTIVALVVWELLCFVAGRGDREITGSGIGGTTGPVAPD